MLKNRFHQIVANPFVYDWVQVLVGSKKVRQRLSSHLQNLPANAIVVDIGGGTGINRELLPANCRYICLDNDSLKLKGFREKFPAEIGILGDATQIPMQSGSIDVVLCTAVSHHIPDAILEDFFRESVRLLKADGQFVFLDAVWSPKRLPSRLLWRYDRGSYPRPLKTLQAILAQHGTIKHSESFAVLHRYLIAVVTRP